MSSLHKWLDGFRQRCKRVIRGDELGLTLIELLAVVVILGVVAAIAVPSVSGAISEAKVNTTETNLGTLQQALERYNADNGSYPATLEVLGSTTNGNGPYVTSSFPMVDGWGNSIVYAQIGNGTGYVVLSDDSSSFVAASGAQTITKLTSLSTGTKYIYAAGGTDTNGVSIAAVPQVGKVSTTIGAVLPTATFNS